MHLKRIAALKHEQPRAVRRRQRGGAVGWQVGVAIGSQGRQRLAAVLNFNAAFQREDKPAVQCVAASRS